MLDLETRVAALEERAQTERNRGRDKNKRYAFEWYMKHCDQFYWKLTKERIASKVEPLEKRQKKITVLAVTSTVIGLAGLVLAVCTYLK